MIKYENGARRYWDKNGAELHEGDVVQLPSGRMKTLYRYDDGCGDTGLGTDATNPAWIESGRAVECQYGICPLTLQDTEEITKLY